MHNKTQPAVSQNKYYFISSMWAYSAYGQTSQFKPQQEVADKHPFEVMAECEKETPEYEVVLLSWREITKEEYDLYNKLEL